MKIRKDKVERIRNGKKQILYPEEIKLQIVKDLEAGKLTVKDVMRKYGINRSETVYDWLRKYSTDYREQKVRAVRSVAERRQIVYKIESGIMNIESAIKQCDVCDKTIRNWIKLYTCKTIIPETMVPKTSQTQEESEETKLLRKQLELLTLKVEGLETLIDIAEKELHIDIRKKSGTKQ
ncbi:MAG: transposase [Bacteroidota bacterium]|nr:transposase [Bacteroidota bacterium]